MSAWLIWLIISGVLAAAEAASLSFVLIMAAGGALAGALTAVLGGPAVLQVLVAIAGTRNRSATGSAGGHGRVRREDRRSDGGRMARPLRLIEPERTTK